MKFLIIAPRFHTNLYYRVLALKNAGHVVKVLTLYKGKSEFYKDVDFKTLRLSFLSRLMSLISKTFIKNDLKSSLELRVQSPGSELRKEIISFKPDVIILKAYQNLLAIKTLIVARKFKIKVLMLTQTTFTHIKGSKLLFRLNIRLFKKLGVYAYITPIKSNFTAFINTGIKNVFYVPFVYPVATTFSKSKSENSNLRTNSEIKIISVGKFVKRKEQLLLIKACHQLIKQDFEIKLTIFGENADEDYYHKIIGYIKRNKLEKKVSIFENVSYNYLLNKYQEHDIYVLPSYAEPAAYSPVEAMANGLPVIVSSDCGTKCYINEGKNGFVFEAKNLMDLTEKIKNLISDKNRIRKMSENATIFAQEHHYLKGFSDAIIKIIDN